MKKGFLITTGLLVVAVALQLLIPLKPPQVDFKSRAEISAKPGDAGTSSVSGLPDVEYYDAMRARPLFTSTRRPPPREEVVQQQTVRKTGDPKFQLTGIVMGAGKPYAMIVGGGRGAEMYRLGKGDSADGWVVDEILAEKLVLMNGKDRYDMPLRTFKPVTSVPAPAKPADKDAVAKQNTANNNKGKGKGKKKPGHWKKKSAAKKAAAAGGGRG